MIFDLHNDFPTAIDKTRFNAYASACEGKVTAAIWTSEFDTVDAETRVADILGALSGLNEPIAIEDIGFLGENERYEIFDFSKFFYCSLTWNHNNRFAGGALDDGDLTKIGRRAIRRMNCACAVDLAHLNKKSFFAALDVAKHPICSHTGFNSHPRSLDGDQIKALVMRNAPIGLCAVAKFTDAYTAAELADVMDGFVQSYGIDRLCLGTDFNGSVDLPKDLKSYDDLYRVADRLNKLGYRQKDIDNIFYGNAMRFYEEIQYERHL